MKLLVVPVLLRELAEVLGQRQRVYERCPWVVLGAAKERPRVEGGVVVLAAQLEVMIVVGEQVGEHVTSVGQSVDW
ncbi:MAG: hypothetical protein ACFLMY_04180 [Candidatus Brachytrichaceae bacterium NZ_4S206]